MILDVQYILGADPLSTESQALVTRIHDGDTVEGNIRLLGMDAPEIKQEPYGRIARAWLINHVLGKTITLRKDSRARDHDKYGRLLRWLVLNEEVLNIEAVKEGFAVKYIIGNIDYKAELEMAEASAKNGKLGIWSDPNFILPSEFRKHGTNQSSTSGSVQNSDRPGDESYSSRSDDYS